MKNIFLIRPTRAKLSLPTGSDIVIFHEIALCIADQCH